MTFQERRYQTRAKGAFGQWLPIRDSRLATIILPTGVGKTATAALCLQGAAQAKVLWVAHREELVEQATQALTKLIPSRKIEIEMADHRANPNSEIVVGSVQTVARNRKHFQEFKPDIIVIDEYHHYSEDNVQYDGLLQRWQEAKVLGLTATPWRFSGDDLPLGEVLIRMDIGTAVDKGYLVTPRPEVLTTDVSLAGVNNRAGDFDIKGLSQAVNVDSRNQLIAKRVIELVRDCKRQGILFSVDVAHSKAMKALLGNEVRVAEVYGETPIEERREIMARIRNGEVDVLCNNLVATEGFDVPHLSFVVIARPTRSLGLFIQMAGRGLRTSPNKTDCIILDIYDKIKAKQSRVTFKDMAVAGDLYGDRKRATNILVAEPKVEGVAKKLTNFPIFIRPEKMDRWQTDEETLSISSWALGQDQWIVSWSAEIKTQKKVSRAIWVPFETLPTGTVDLVGRPVRHPKYGEGKIKSVAEQGEEPKIVVTFDWNTDRVMLMKSLERVGYVQEDVPNQFEVNKVERLFYLCLPPTETAGRVLAFERAGRDLLLREDKRLSKIEAEAWLEQQAMEDGILALVKSNARWKKQPASEKQIDFVKKLIAQDRVGFDLDLDLLSKGEVSSIIEQSKWQDLINQKFGTNYKNKLLGYDVLTEDV
jgi:superfamily II DNA or RNA helicase